MCITRVWSHITVSILLCLNRISGKAPLKVRDGQPVLNIPCPFCQSSMLYWRISPLFSIIHVSLFCHLIDAAPLTALRLSSSFCPGSLLLLVPTAYQLFPLSLSLSCQSPWAPFCFLSSHNTNPLGFLVYWFWMRSLTLCLSYYSVLCIYSAHFKTMSLFKYCISSEAYQRIL